MDAHETTYTKLYNKNGQLEGVFISASFWEKVQSRICPIMDSVIESLQPKEIKEPIKDWENLLQHWDFSYPVDTTVICDTCGSSTNNWQHDEPRKFILKAANIGGLVSFECLECKSRVTKKHFKKHIDSKTVPPQKK